MSLRAAILIVSETASKDPTTDKGIPALQEVFASATGKGGGDQPQQQQWIVQDTKIVPDDIEKIKRAILQWTDESAGEDDCVNLVVTSGGTGFARGDVTPEVSSTWREREREAQGREMTLDESKLYRCDYLVDLQSLMYYARRQ